MTSTETPLVPVSLTHGKLPRFTPLAVFVVSLVVVGGLLAVFGVFSIPLVVVLGTVVFAVALLIISRVVEGGRAATDRFATTLMYSAFGLALVPLISLIWTV